MKEKNLKRTKGESDYDYENDILLFKRRDGTYDYSINYDEFIIDIDSDGSVRGIQLFCASKMLRMSKNALKNIIQFEFIVELKDKLISIQLHFKTEFRNNKIQHYYQDFVREGESECIKSAKVICST